jgi:hypothetical protein
MTLKACQQNLTLSIHVLCVHKIVGDQDEDVQDCKVKHDWDKDIASKDSLGHQEA